ncbi:MAG: efflux RND transporter periplasmic adaptor subunit [Pseudomonadota bacterium]
MDIQRTKKKKLLNPATISVLLVLGIAATIYVLSSLDYSTLRVDRENVLIGTVEFGDLDITVAANGVLLARDVELISSQVEGTVKRIYVKPGDIVETGQVLAELENPLLGTSVELNQFALDGAKADLVASRINIENQILNQESALIQSRFSFEKAKLNLEANRRLIAKQVISQIEFQQTELDVEQKEQLVAIEEQRLQKSKDNQTSQLAVLDASIRQAEQNLARSLSQQSNLKVTTRMPGVIQQMNLDIGQNLRAGEQLGRIANQAVLYAQLDVPSLQASELAMGQRVELNTRNGVIEGTLSRIDPAVINGTVLVDVDIISELPASARPELTVEGTIYIAEIRNSLYVQRPAASRSHAEQSLFRLDAEQEYAERTIVELGRVAVNHVEIMSGLSKGDRIIISDNNDWQKENRILLSN